MKSWSLGLQRLTPHLTRSTSACFGSLTENAADVSTCESSSAPFAEKDSCMGATLNLASLVSAAFAGVPE